MGLSLSALPPFRLDLTVWALRRRPANATDVWDGGTYPRATELDGGPVDYDGVRAAVARFQPYAGLVHFHLLLAGIDPTTEEPA